MTELKWIKGVEKNLLNGNLSSGEFDRLYSKYRNDVLRWNARVWLRDNDCWNGGPYTGPEKERLVKWTEEQLPEGAERMKVPRVLSKPWNYKNKYNGISLSELDMVQWKILYGSEMPWGLRRKILKKEKFVERK